MARNLQDASMEGTSRRFIVPWVLASIRRYVYALGRRLIGGPYLQHSPRPLPTTSSPLSVGMLLAAHERDIPIAAAAVEEYEILTGVRPETFDEANQLCCLWLAGTPYQ